MKFLVFDLETTGHHPGYLEHLIAGWLDCAVFGELHIVVAHDFPILFPHIIEKANSANRSSIHIHLAPEALSLKYRALGNKYLQGWAGFSILSPFVNRLSPDRIFFLKIDYYLLPLAFRAIGKRYRKRVSGILFMFGGHYKKLFDTDIPLLFKIRNNIYRVALIIMGIRSVVHTLMSLDETAIPYLKQLCPNSEIVPCPDPVNISAAKTATPVPLHKLGIDPERVVFLTIGFLSIEKGVFDVLQSVHNLDEEKQKMICLLFVGPIVETDKVKVEEMIRSIREKALVQVVLHEKVVKEEDMQDYIAVADYILILYRQHIGRSAILVRAAAAGIFVISNRWGLIGWQVEALGLGRTVVAHRKSDVAGVIHSVLEERPKFIPTKEIEEFVENNSREVFARSVMLHGAGVTIK